MIDEYSYQFNPTRVFFYSFFLLYIGFLVLPVLVLPLYISVFRSNRERERETAVYPITLHFYRLIYVYYSVFILEFVVFQAVLRHYPASFKPYTMENFSISYAIFLLAILLMFNLAYTHQALLSLLALQRFLLYFFPDLESRINFGMKNTTRLIYGIHSLCLLPFLLFSILTRIAFWFGRADLYGPSVTTNFLNTQITVIIFLPIAVSRGVVSFTTDSKNDAKTDFDTSFMSFQLDFLSTPLLIEIPYLFCNRRNVEEMRKRLSFKYLWSKIWNRNNQVGGIDNSDNQIFIVQSTHS
ncbi:Protein CBG18627 [Caenorhabditis briggsae]|uniref:Protein CBG18627 n=1 Tax=Caenorhabditis briggsae TaxID=6238 RepID=A8XTR3_CAEBR|nr:Protein CBG18627 [Caenorhabditis briggsae]CAP36039.2 Protein CBG18627 [Caenorhabditis briggsae]